MCCILLEPSCSKYRIPVISKTYKKQKQLGFFLGDEGRATDLWCCGAELARLWTFMWWPLKFLWEAVREENTVQWVVWAEVLAGYFSLQRGQQVTGRIRDIGEIFFLTFMWPCLITNFFITKSTRCTNFTNLFWNESLHVSDSSPAHHQEFIHCTLSNDMSYRFVDSFRAVPSWSCSKAVYKPVWHIPLLNVQWINSWWWAGELSETCRVSYQNKFVKLVHHGRGLWGLDGVGSG